MTEYPIDNEMPRYRSVFTASPRVVIDEGDYRMPGVPLHFGDPSGEQWALEAGSGLVDRGDLGIVTVTGADRQKWLTSLSSQIVTGMSVGDSKELLILDPQGHIEHACAVLDDGDTTWLVTALSRTQALEHWLNSMKFMLRVDVRRPDNRRIFATVGEASTRGVSHLPGYCATWTDPWPGVSDGGAEYFQGAHPAENIRMFLHLVDADAASDFAHAWMLADAKRRPTGWLAWNAMRIAAWKPDIAFDVDERTIPAELDWLRTAVHTNKGCYRGQESVARVINLGRPPRRLVMLQLDGSRGDLPAVGSAIMWGPRRVGTVTSVARHADWGPIALALVMRNVPADVVFDLDGIAAAQEVIVPVDGKSSISPAQRPGVGMVNPALRRPDVPAFGGGSAIGGRS
ncbi:YgfZ/GcvT domain-containing protein [Schaalia suimastitidis]|uniref:CAF17-like 4Fe-4S cluster assembly/insertion protein YgfZ n=1 Tax=Schaalia suimastitidis TaxID=121163 RepID=UPI0003F950E0|nr:folate-binding protein [Schaalia suimastitidis]